MPLLTVTWITRQTRSEEGWPNTPPSVSHPHLASHLSRCRQVPGVHLAVVHIFSVFLSDDRRADDCPNRSHATNKLSIKRGQNTTILLSHLQPISLYIPCNDHIKRRIRHPVRFWTTVWPHFRQRPISIHML